MTYNTRCCILILLTLAVVIKGDLQDLLNLQHRRTHLPDTKFGYSEYAEYPDANEPEQAANNPLWNTIPLRNVEATDVQPAVERPQINITSEFDQNITWDKNWGEHLSFGQLSAIDLDPNGNIALFSRRERVWGQSTFNLNNIFNRAEGPIKRNTIILFNKKGEIIFEWGKNMFYMPHGLTIDNNGNYWLTDVAMHQVFKFNKDEIKENIVKFNEEQNNPDNQIFQGTNNNLFSNSIVKPSIILGIAFEPGSDDKRFCKPTAVAVAINGDFFVSDGYCNSRVIKFNKNGERIQTIGRALTMNDHFPSPYSLFVPHALAIAHEFNYIYVADREHGRILCYSSQNGSFYREYKNIAIGTRIYSIAYARERIYLVNGAAPYTSGKFHVRGFAIDIHSGNIVSQFGPNEDMIAPHDIAVAADASEIYVPELDKPIIYRFLQGNTSKSLVQINTAQSKNSADSSLRQLKPLTSDNSSHDTSTNMTTIILTLVISAIILIALCIAIAAVVARCHKRGCLLSIRRKGYWPSESNDNFTLSSLLGQGKNFRNFDKRPNTRDFSKLNTEPQSSEDEHMEDSLII